jgi:hypothetical protein
MEILSRERAQSNNRQHPKNSGKTVPDPAHLQTSVPTKNSILMKASKILPTVSPFYVVNTSAGAVLKIF